jgi:zinc transporter ZupT
VDTKTPILRTKLQKKAATYATLSVLGVPAYIGILIGAGLFFGHGDTNSDVFAAIVLGGTFGVIIAGLVTVAAGAIWYQAYHAFYERLRRKNDWED